MKKTFIIIFLCFQSIYSYSQNALNLESTIIYEAKVILPTFNNLTQLLFADMSEFKKTMEKYEYTYSNDNERYTASNHKAVFFYSLRKKSNEISAVFVPDEYNLVSKFRKELKESLKSGTVSFESGFEVYRLSTVKDGFRYNIKIGIKEELSDYTMGIISFILE